MNTKITHTQHWRVEVEREDHDDGWPEKDLLSGTSTRYIRPYKLVLLLNTGRPPFVQVLGKRIGPPGDTKSPIASSRWMVDKAPEWVQVLVTKIREQNRLGPGSTGVDW